MLTTDMEPSGRKADSPAVSPEAAGAAWLNLQRLLFARFRPRLVEAWRELDLGPPHQMALRLLERPRPMGDLAGHLQCDNSHMTGIVDRLEERGLVERRAVSGDRRVRLVALTDEGERIRAELERRLSAPPPEMTDLPPRELAAFVATVEKMAAALPDEGEAITGSVPAQRWS